MKVEKDLLGRGIPHQGTQPPHLVVAVLRHEVEYVTWFVVCGACEREAVSLLVVVGWGQQCIGCYHVV